MNAQISTSKKRDGKAVDVLDPHGTAQSILHLLRDGVRDGARPMAYILAAFGGASTGAVSALVDRHLVERFRKGGKWMLRLSDAGLAVANAASAAYSDKVFKKAIAAARAGNTETNAVEPMQQTPTRPLAKSAW